MQVMTIRSGSSANCILIKQNNYGILIDAGIGIRTLNAALIKAELDISRIAAIFITHEHTDHTKGLETILKNNRIPVFGNRATLNEIERKLLVNTNSFIEMPTSSTAACPDMQVTSFKTPHDSIESVGFIVSDGKKKFALATDIGVVTKEVALNVTGCNTVLLESNYDEQMLKTGTYPYILKKRILSEKGHLSNDSCAKFAPMLVNSGTERVILGHLSQNNNTPQLAFETTQKSLESNNIKVNKDVLLYTASRTETSEIYEV